MKHTCPNCGFDFDDAPGAAPAPAPAAAGNASDLCAQAARSLQAGDFEAALALAERACLEGPTARGFELRGQALFSLERYDESAAVFDELLAMEPNHPVACYFRGRVFEFQGMTGAALDHYDRALEARPGMAEPLWAKAQTLEALRRPKEALDAYALLAQGSLADNGIFHNMAACARALGDFRAETNYLRRFLENPPAGSEEAVREARRRLASADAQEALAAAQSARDPEAVVRALENLLALAPRDRDLRRQLGDALAAAGKFKESAACFDALLREDPSDAAAAQAGASALGRLADAALAEGRSVEARKLFEQAAKFGPGTPPGIAAGLEACDEFSQARLFEDQGVLAEALAGYERVLQAKPEFVEARWLQARALEASARPQDALEAYSRLGSRTNLFPELYSRMAACAQALGDVASELLLLRRFLEAPPPGQEEAVREARQRLSVAEIRAKASQAGQERDPGDRKGAEAKALEDEVGGLCARAAAALAQGRTQEAQDLFERAAGLDGERKNPVIAAGLASCHLRASRFEAALAEADRATVLSPTADHYRMRGVALFALERRAEAASVFEEVLSSSPGDWEANYYRGQIFEAEGALPEALDRMKRALEARPGFPEGLWARGRILEAMGRPREALDDYVLLAKSPQPDIGVYLRMAACGRAIGEFGYEAACLRRYLESPPPNSEEAVREAGELLSLALARDKVAAATRRGDPAVLAEALRELVRLSPGDRGARARLGETLGAAKRWEEAAACFDALLRENPGDEAALEAKGLALVEMGRWAEAISCLEGAARRRPVRDEPWRAYVKCLRELGRREELGRFCRETLETSPGHAEACFHVAVEVRNADAAKALEMFRRFLVASAPPGLENLQSHARKEIWILEHPAAPIRPAEAAEMIQRGDQLSMIENLSGALAFYEKAVAADPTSGPAWAAKGSVLLFQNRAAEALECLAKACEFDPANAAHWKKRAAALERVGRRAEAGECWGKVRAINPGDPSLPKT